MAISMGGHFGESPELTRRIEVYQERSKTTHIPADVAPSKDSLIFASNDYLGLVGDRRIAAAQTRSLNGDDNALLMSAVFLAEGSAQQQFEDKMAAFLGVEDAVLCQSGWCANDGLLQSIADAATPVYIDISAHMSLWQGAHSAGAKARPFRHNSVENLASLIARYGAGIIVVDSVYSTTGDFCPLREMADLARETGSIFVVDESHSIGCFGPAGSGLVRELGLEDQVHFRTFSLSKAMVGRAGVVAGPKRVLDYMRFESRPAIFSSAVLPMEIAGFSATLDIVREADHERRTLQQNADYLRDGLLSLGFDVTRSQTQIISFETGPEQLMTSLRRALERRGVYGASFCAPATPKTKSRVRLSVSSGHSTADLDAVLTACAEIKEELDVYAWPRLMLQPFAKAVAA